jgi:hypothetical protein
MERAVVEGALEAARKDNSRLQSEVAALRSTLRRGAPLAAAPVPEESEAEPRARKIEPAQAAPAPVAKA